MNKTEETREEKDYWLTKNRYTKRTYAEECLPTEEYVAGMKEKLRYKQYLRSNQARVLSFLNKIIDYLKRIIHDS